MRKRAKRIAKSLETAIDRACRSYGSGIVLRTGGFETEVGRVDAAELRDLVELWWRVCDIDRTSGLPSGAFRIDDEAVAK